MSASATQGGHNNKDHVAATELSPMLLCLERQPCKVAVRICAGVKQWRMQGSSFGLDELPSRIPSLYKTAVCYAELAKYCFTFFYSASLWYS